LWFGCGEAEKAQGRFRRICNQEGLENREVIVGSYRLQNFNTL